MSTNGLLILSALLYAVWLAWYHKRPQIRKFKRPIGRYIPLTQQVYLRALSNNLPALLQAIRDQQREQEIQIILKNHSYNTIKSALKGAASLGDLRMTSIYAEALKRMDNKI